MRKSLDGIFSYLALFTGGNLIVSLLGRIYDLPKAFSYLPSELLNRLSAGLLFCRRQPDGKVLGDRDRADRRVFSGGICGVSFHGGEMRRNFSVI